MKSGLIYGNVPVIMWGKYVFAIIGLLAVFGIGWLVGTSTRQDQGTAEMASLNPDKATEKAEKAQASPPEKSGAVSGDEAGQAGKGKAGLSDSKAGDSENSQADKGDGGGKTGDAGAKTAGAGNQADPISSGELDLPVSESADVARLGGEEGDSISQGKIKKGDTIQSILDKAGGEDFDPLVDAARRVFSMRSFKDGQPYAVVTDSEDGRVKRFEYEIDSKRRLVVEGADSPVARVEPIHYMTILDSVKANIDDNLFQAVADIGESPKLAIRLSELFGAEINFARDLQEGDKFSVLVEKRYLDGTYKGYGRILAAHFTCKGKTWEAYLFNDGEGRPQYFNRKGENLRKTLLQSPLAITRVSSRFSHNRRHPILGYSRPHLGVDYAAPTGTPVKAVGDGEVTFRGWNGGYGHQVVIKHSSGLESMYSHLSGYARGLKVGGSVRQGQVIAFVGSTGLSTGPHLDFRLKRDGTFINPAKSINPRGEPVSVRRKAAFNSAVQRSLDYMSGKLPLSDYLAAGLVADSGELPDWSETPEMEVAAGEEKPVRAAYRRPRVVGGRYRLDRLDRMNRMFRTYENPYDRIYRTNLYGTSLHRNGNDRKSAALAGADRRKVVKKRRRDN